MCRLSNIFIRFMVTFVLVSIVSYNSPVLAAELPPYIQTLTAAQDYDPSDIANRDVLQLNSTMFEFYGDATAIFKRNIMAEHPIILALFSGSGGRFILYRPGMPPVDAPSVPITYQLLKSIAHSTMALAKAVMPHLDHPRDQSWRSAMLAYRSRMQSALDSLELSAMPAEWRETNRHILQNNLTFMDDCLAARAIGYADLQKLAGQQAPLLKKNIAWAAQTQVAHWMGVMDEWKKSLADSWDDTYAASNTIYVARQNNILFSVLAQYFGPNAINEQLMLIETISFTTTPDDMLDSLTRIIADRAVGAVFFGNYRLMDYELMGGDGRAAIAAEAGKRGIDPFLPPLVPFGSHQWPALVTPGPGAGSIAELP